MKNEVIFCVVGFVAGGIVGVGTTLLIQHIKRSKKTEQLPTNNPESELKSSTEEEDYKEVDEAIRVEITPEEMEEFKEILAREGYADREEEEEDPADSEYPEDDDPDNASYRAQLELNASLEKYKKDHEGIIELMTEDQWTYESDFSEDDYDREELFFFRDSGELTDEDGNFLSPIEDYVGDLFTKTRFWTNDWQVLYIRNHPMETDYKVTKPLIEESDERGFPVYKTVSRDEFFY